MMKNIFIALIFISGAVFAYAPTPVHAYQICDDIIKISNAGGYDSYVDSCERFYNVCINKGNGESSCNASASELSTKFQTYMRCNDNAPGDPTKCASLIGIANDYLNAMLESSSNADQTNYATTTNAGVSAANTTTADTTGTDSSFCTNGTCTYAPLEPIPGVDESGTNFVAILTAFFKILFWVAGGIAVGSLVYAGYAYMTSEAIGSLVAAKERIKAVMFGLVILLGSWVILETINPQLTGGTLVTDTATNALNSAVGNTTTNTATTQSQLVGSSNTDIQTIQQTRTIRPVENSYGYLYSNSDSTNSSTNKNNTMQTFFNGCGALSGSVQGVSVSSGTMYVCVPN